MKKLKAYRTNCSHFENQLEDLKNCPRFLLHRHHPKTLAARLTFKNFIFSQFPRIPSETTFTSVKTQFPWLSHRHHHHIFSYSYSSVIPCFTPSRQENFRHLIHSMTYDEWMTKALAVHESMIVPVGHLCLTLLAKECP